MGRPSLLKATVNGEACSVDDGSILRPAPVEAGDVDIRLEVADEVNPLSTTDVRCTVEGLTCSSCRLHPAEATGAPAKRGIVTVVLQSVPPGAYEGCIFVSDLAPWPNELKLPFALNVVGISVSSDRQRVTLANSAGEFVFQADREKQLLLPGRTWAKLTTRMGNKWLYPRRITDVQVRKEADGTQGVLITTDVQDIDGKEVKGLGMLEYNLRIRIDTPALFVSTRSKVISPTPQRNTANWGWLPAAYYVTPEGKKEWRGLAQNKYLPVGNVGWLWLAPKNPSKQWGLVWISEARFGESRFDTMLLYGANKSCMPQEYVEISFAIAPAATAEQGRAISEDLVRRRLIAPPGK